jgi:hypothetical protein
MGINVTGRCPSEESGETFYTSSWEWGALYELICEICDDLLGEDTLAQMANEDDFVLADPSVCQEMANLFESAAQLWQHGYTAEYDKLRLTEEGRFVTAEQVAKNPHLKTRSPFFVRPEHVREWIEFLRHCGGFFVY